jgi:Xaa-Pro aminopeptidase
MERMRDPERERILRDAIKSGGFQAILVWYPEDIIMACGTWPCLGLTICLYPAEGQPVFYASSNEPDDVLPPGFLHRRFAPGDGARSELKSLLADDLRRLDIESGELGIPVDDGQHAVTSFPGETPPMTSHAIEVILGDFRTRDATAAFTAAGQCKTPLEIEALRRANAAADAGLDAFHQALEPGTSEAEIAARVESAIQCFSGQQGCGLARGWAHVQGGANAEKGGTFSRSSALRVDKGDLALIELATCVDGYWSDLTRTAGVGELGPKQRALLACVKEAQAAAIAAVRPGISHEAVDAAARRVLIDKGYGSGIIHAFGHHVGFRYHDRGPALQPGSTAMLEEGMVITIEPGTYGRQLGGGARFEDNILVGPKGAVLLSPIGNSWQL